LAAQLRSSRLEPSSPAARVLGLRQKPQQLSTTLRRE